MKGGEAFSPYEKVQERTLALRTALTALARRSLEEKRAAFLLVNKPP